MPVGVLKNGGSVVFGIPLSPFSGWQHGSIDASLVGRASTFSRVLCFASAGWSARSTDPTVTSFAVSNEIIMGPQEAIPRGVVKVTDYFFGVSSLVDVGKSSITFIMKLYLSVDEPGVGEAPGESMMNEKGDLASPVKKPKTETLKLIWANSGDSTSSPLPSELIGIPLGSSTITIVNISKETRKSCPISPERREDFFSHKSEELLKQWEEEGYVPKRDTRVQVDFNMVMKASEAFQKAWNVEKDGLVEFTCSCLTHEGVNSLVADEMDRIVPPESTNVIKNESEFSRKWRDETIFIFTNVIGLRPEDFDFNRHLNMNMYISFTMDAIRMSLHEYLDYVGTKRAVSKESATLMCPVEVAGGPDNGEQNEGNVGTYHADHLGRFLLANNHQTLISNIIASKKDISPMSLYHDSPISAAVSNQPHSVQSGKSLGLSIEEMVKRSRIEYLREISDIHSRVEVTVYSHHKDTGSDNMRDKCNDDFSLCHDPVLLKFIVRCLPPIPAKNRKPSYVPYVAAIGEILL